MEGARLTQCQSLKVEQYHFCHNPLIEMNLRIGSDSRSDKPKPWFTGSYQCNRPAPQINKPLNLYALMLVIQLREKSWLFSGTLTIKIMSTATNTCQYAIVSFVCEPKKHKFLVPEMVGPFLLLCNMLLTADPSFLLEVTLVAQHLVKSVCWWIMWSKELVHTSANPSFPPHMDVLSYFRRISYM